jgi:ABC-type ATPase involved in cell division
MLGKNVYHGRRSLIGITQADRLGHMWVLGKTGAGKSTLLTNLIYEDMQAGRGLMVIDPHGDLVVGREKPRLPLCFSPQVKPGVRISRTGLPRTPS